MIVISLEMSDEPFFIYDYVPFSLIRRAVSRTTCLNTARQKNGNNKPRHTIRHTENSVPRYSGNSTALKKHKKAGTNQRFSLNEASMLRTSSANDESTFM